MPTHGYTQRNKHTHAQNAHTLIQTMMNTEVIYTDLSMPCTPNNIAHSATYKHMHRYMRHTPVDTRVSQMPDEVSQSGNLRFYKLQSVSCIPHKGHVYSCDNSQMDRADSGV